MKHLSPQCKTVLLHLKQAGSITNVEANAVHRIRALPRRIRDLREMGYRISDVMRKDTTGQRYKRYYLDD